MFTAEERKEYGFGTFEEDLKATNDECYGKGDMAWEDLEKRADGSHKSIRHGLGALPSDLADVCCELVHDIGFEAEGFECGSRPIIKRVTRNRELADD